MDIIFNKHSYFNKKVFYTALVISLFLNILILIFFSSISKIVNPPQLPKEPKIKFIKLEKKEEVLLKPKKKIVKTELEKKSSVKPKIGEKKAKTASKEKIKPAQLKEGKKVVKREVKINKPKVVLPPKEKKVISQSKTKETVKKKSITTPKPEQQKKVANKPPNIIRTEKNVERKLPPPPKEPALEDNYSLAPPKSPDVNVGENTVAQLEKMEGLKEESPSKLLKGVKTVSPTTKQIEFGKSFKEYDKNIEGTAKTRRLIYMPPPPKIKTKIILPPKSIKVKIWITPDGMVSNVVLLKKTGDPSLDRAIIEYVKSWKFNKIEKDEVQWAITTIRFKIK